MGAAMGYHITMDIWKILVWVLVAPVLACVVLAILYQFFPTKKQMETTKWFWLRRVAFHKRDLMDYGAMAKNPNLTPAELAFLGRWMDAQSHVWVAGNPNTPLQTLEALGNQVKPFRADVKKALLANEAIPEGTRIWWALQWGLV